MSNKLKDIDIKLCAVFFQWHDQYKKSWFKENNDG